MNRDLKHYQHHVFPARYVYCQHRLLSVLFTLPMHYFNRTFTQLQEAAETVLLLILWLASIL